MALVDQAHPVYGGRKADDDQDEAQPHGPVFLG
jgi:hypothetical protein